MSAGTAIARGRAAAARLMVDACTITRVTGSTTDPGTGQVTDVTETLYTGPCRVQQAAGVARAHDVGQATVYQLPLQVHVPATVTGLQVADVVTITASQLDPDLPGRKFWIRELAHKSHATAHRLGVEEVTS